MPRVIHKPKNKQGGFGPQNLKDQIFGRQKRSGMAGNSASANNQKIILGSLSREALRNGLFKGAGALAGVAGVAALSVLSMPAYAETSGTVDLMANVAEAGLSLTLSNSTVALNLAAPYSGTAFDSEPVTVTVSAHNGYSLVMYGGTNLVSGNNTIQPVGSACNSGCNSDNFTTNAWGYSVDNTTSYKPMTSGYNQLKSETGDLPSAATVVNFGAKVNYEQTPGTYTTTLNFLAVANVTTPITMQGFDSTYCGTGGPTLVTDNRDNKEYLVQRLEDGKCWMLDNLAFDPTAYTGSVADLAARTNADATTLGYFKNGGGTGQYASSGVTTEWKLTDTENTATCTSDPSQCTDNWTVPRVKTSGVNTSGGAYQNIEYNANSTAPVTYGDAGNKIGVWYNYCAASAGSYCYAKEQGTGNATSDICPAGWRLPTGGGSGEFQNLYSKYDATAVDGVNGYAFRAALSAPLSGYVGNSSGAVVYVGASGYWWSSTRVNGNYVYRLSMDTTDVYPAGSSYRSNGFTVRCVLQ